MHDFTGTRLWLETKTQDKAVIDEVVTKIHDSGAWCDCEIISMVKPRVNGGTLLVNINKSTQ